MLLNKAFRRAAGMVVPGDDGPVPLSPEQERLEKRGQAALAARQGKAVEPEDLSKLPPRLAARRAARTPVAKHASLDGTRLPFAERAGYLREIFERAAKRQALRP